LWARGGDWGNGRDLPGGLFQEASQRIPSLGEIEYGRYKRFLSSGISGTPERAENWVNCIHVFDQVIGVRNGVDALGLALRFLPQCRDDVNRESHQPRHGMRLVHRATRDFASSYRGPSPPVGKVEGRSPITRTNRPHGSAVTRSHKNRQ
jgi:hypothetical protein